MQHVRVCLGSCMVWCIYWPTDLMDWCVVWCIDQPTDLMDWCVVWCIYLLIWWTGAWSGASTDLLIWWTGVWSGASTNLLIWWTGAWSGVLTDLLIWWTGAWSGASTNLLIWWTGAWSGASINVLIYGIASCGIKHVGVVGRRLDAGNSKHMESEMDWCVFWCIYRPTDLQHSQLWYQTCWCGWKEAVCWGLKTYGRTAQLKLFTMQ